MEESRIKFIDFKFQNALCQRRVEEAALSVLRSGKFILGSHVSTFERRAAELTGFTYTVGVSSGTDALVAALLALDIGPGDEVITTPFTFFATTTAIQLVGATPVYADINPDTLLLDPEKAVREINKKTKAIIPVSLFGNSYPIADLMSRASGSGVYVIEDAAQRFAERNSSVGPHIACYSFFPSKVLGACGDAGMVATDISEIFDKLKMIRVQGSKSKNIHERTGGNFRMDTLQAAILLAKLKFYPLWINMRKSAAEIYSYLFDEYNIKGITNLDRNYQGIFSLYTVKAENRNNLIKHLEENGIESAVYYPVPAYNQKALKNKIMYLLEETENACQSVLSLPFYPGISFEDQLRVVECIRDFYE
jgi:dTDP-4-amino-4,6-dideoxygalactose transaminase